ncbi:MAG: 3',5'-cyclic-nucleotide phosphodiesterase [Halobacteriovoraceae bacterium]|nr:3',5'-cyclic-nucleotide phosphodiesterase [Halobacteriovoraceae bacterium]|tara:strand:- start:3036 stop:3803 length:768 start_codon:yes stop_codon:yes gene_type:complete
MQVKIIGGHGGVTKNYNATSYLIDDALLIDAGSVASGLDIEDQLKIDHILISHAHLDHTKDLAFICDNCFGLKGKPFQVYSHKTVHKAIKDHLFNDTIWPDFSVLPTEKNPTIQFNEIDNEKEIILGDYKVVPVHVQHPGDAYGFIVEKGDVAILFTQDTAATDRIWEVGKKYKNLKAIFTEVSFPNHLQTVADLSDHHSPQTMKEELKKMPKDVPVYLGHLKPNYQEQLIQEITDLGEPRLHIMYADDVRYQFE